MKAVKIIVEQELKILDKFIFQFFFFVEINTRLLFLSRINKQHIFSIFFF